MGDDPIERMRRRHTISGADVFLEMEREVLGSDHRANGYTTVAQADEMGRLAGLDPGMVLLDLGSGCGWPGLHLARSTGCDVVTVDPQLPGVVATLDRAERDALGDRHLGLLGEGAHLPVRDESVDAVVHVDVLC